LSSIVSSTLLSTVFVFYALAVNFV
jgi:hypothetical protein